MGIRSSGKKPLHERFILLMGDHFFEESIPMRIKNERAADGEVLVGVDHNIETVDTVRGNDSTKVLVEEGRILDIGKNIKKYNAYDTGIFLCSPALFAAMEESLQQKMSRG
jgi:choline kinase